MKTIREIKYPYQWGSSTIVHMLENPSYQGHTCNFKTRKHFKDKKSHYVDQDKWTIIENTHEPIIDQETFDNVQRLRKNIRRYPDGWGEAHPLGGLLYCADCGGKMYVHRTNNGKREAQFTCAEYGKVPVGSRCATQHRVKADVVMTLIRETLREIIDFSKEDEEEFVRIVRKAVASQQTSEVTEQKGRLEQCRKRSEGVKGNAVPFGRVLYESLPYHNCVFLGYDESHIARYAYYRSICHDKIMGEAAGSDKHFSFRIDHPGSSLHVFESAIDLLSFASKEKIWNGAWPRESMLSLGGVYVPGKQNSREKLPAALVRKLETDPNIRKIVLHLDNDAAGKGAAEKMITLLKSSYDIRNELPGFGKDMNDELLFLLSQLKENKERMNEYGRKQDT